MSTTRALVLVPALVLAFAIVPDAAAECSALPTESMVCADVADPENASASADHAGVASAGASTYSYTFFGQTYSGKSAQVFSPVASVAFSESCMGATCAYQDDTVMVWGENVPFTAVALSQSAEGRTLCASSGATFQCQSL